MSDRVQRSFQDSQEAAFRRMVRATVRKAEFTKSERDIVLCVVNQWFHHKGSAKGYIHPGRKRIAKQAGVTVKSVSRCLAMLRAAGAIEALNGVSGGGQIATKYVVHIWPLMTLCGADWVDEFMRGRQQNVPLKTREMSHYQGAKCPTTGGTKCPTVYNLRKTPPCQKVKLGGDDA